MIPDDFYAGTHRSQFDQSPLANQNCTPTSGANGARAATGGRVDRSGAQVRALVKLSEETNPATPGWSLEDLDLAMVRLGVRFEIRRGLWSSAVAVHDTGRMLVLQGDSDQFPNGTCSGTFDGDHCVAVHPGTYPDGRWPLADPICKDRRAETTTVLRSYTEKFAGRVAGRPTTVIRYGVFPDPVPVEVDVISAIKGEDWKPTVTGSQSNGVYRATPDRAAPLVKDANGQVVRLPEGTIVRTIAEISANGENWRLSEIGGKPAYFLRGDLAPLTPGGDPAVDQGLTDYINRKPVNTDAAFLAGRQAEWDRLVPAIEADLLPRP